MGFVIEANAQGEVECESGKFNPDLRIDQFCEREIDLRMVANVQGP
jgi:hypothetical protein